MRVYEIKLDNGEIGYMLVDFEGIPVAPVVKYLKYLSNIGKAANTIKTYCYHLKAYLEFLHNSKMTIEDVSVNLLGEFVSWLRSPLPFGVTALRQSEHRSPRSPQTINAILTAVLGFYDFLFRSNQIDENISNVVSASVTSRYKSFKPFLHHISANKKQIINTLTQRVPKSEVKTLSNKQIHSIKDACSNIRDELLIRLLYEGGLRIDEALELWIEDFNISKNTVKVRKSKTIEGTGRIVFVSADTMNLFQDFLFDIHDEHGFDTNYVFVTLTGKNRGERLSYRAVYSVVERIRKKTGIVFTPHMFRHTFATELHENGTSVAVIQKLLGHRHVQTTIQTYVHPSNELLRAEYEKAQENKKIKEEKKLGKQGEFDTEKGRTQAKD